MKTRDSEIEFIRPNGVLIAACTWNAYREKGRGTVRALCDEENEVLQQAPFDFMPETCIEVDATPYGTKESRMVAGYDPEREVVIYFVRQATGDRTDFDCYKIITTPPPPLAAEEVDE